MHEEAWITSKSSQQTSILENTATNHVGLIVVLLLAMAIRSLFFVGPIASDDSRYMNAAQMLVNGVEPQSLDHAFVRAAFIVWLAAWIHFGAGVWALCISDLVLGVILVWAIYWLGVKLADRRTALTAAFLWTLFPLELLISGIVAPDHLALLLALISAGLAHDGLLAPKGKGLSKLIGAGVCVGLAVSAKETYVLLPVIFGLWALWCIRPLGSTISKLVLIGFVAVAIFALEYPFFQTWTGDWLYRHRSLAAAYGEGGKWQGGSISGVKSLVYYPAQMLINPSTFGLLGWILMVGMLISLRNLKEPGFIVIWSVCFFLFLQYGSTSLLHYTPLPKQWRYIQPIVVLLFLPAGRWLSDMYTSLMMGRVVTIILTLGIGVTGTLAANNRAAEQLYNESVPRSVQIVRTMQMEGKCEEVVISQWGADVLDFESRKAIQDWKRIDLSDSLSVEDMTLLTDKQIVLLIPEIMWWHMSKEATAQQLRQWLNRNARMYPVQDWRSPFDRLLARIGPLRPMAQKAVIGHLYYLDPCDSLTRSSEYAR